MLPVFVALRCTRDFFFPLGIVAIILRLVSWQSRNDINVFFNDCSGRSDHMEKNLNDFSRWPWFSGKWPASLQEQIHPRGSGSNNAKHFSTQSNLCITTILKTWGTSRLIQEAALYRITKNTIVPGLMPISIPHIYKNISCKKQQENQNSFKL